MCSVMCTICNTIECTKCVQGVTGSCVRSGGRGVTSDQKKTGRTFKISKKSKKTPSKKIKKNKNFIKKYLTKTNKYAII